MIIRNFTVIQNTVINTVMSYKTCRQVLNKYHIAPLNTSCLTIEYIFIFVKAISTMLQKHPLMNRNILSFCGVGILTSKTQSKNSASLTSVNVILRLIDVN